jgi:hypothetical protein
MTSARSQRAVSLPCRQSDPMPSFRRGARVRLYRHHKPSHEKVSVYEIESATMAVVARVELDQGTYRVISVVPKQDVRCEE